MNYSLSEVEARVLGSLVEKEITTPEYYPLSLNALVNACNQKSNRDPVMTLDEDAVRSAIRSLNDQGLTRYASTDSRVGKYEHRLNETFNFHRHEIALLCVLLLRGPQTAGELRTRTERMYAFEDLDSLHNALNLLAKREPPLVRVLPRQPGTKESRYVHLLSLVTDEPAEAPSGHDAALAPRVDKVAALETQIAELQGEISSLKEQFAQFRKQFE
ncbi:MAG: YceH family protein [Acidobacteria bacterium]|nr:YceH family protein [Acidobacteriota bacterium]MBS1866378.1 YceH family protein [Acidobacteriota bacterium]